MQQGRPKAELDLPDGWEAAILDIYREGGSDVEVRCWIHEQRGTFSNDLFYRWLEEAQEFSETIKRGKELSELWWRKLGREGASGEHDINPTVWIFNMKNRFNWRDKVDNQHTGAEGGPIKTESTFEYHVVDPGSATEG